MTLVPVGLLCGIGVFTAWAQPQPAGPATPDPAALPNAVHILGLGDIARYAKGTLQVENGRVNFRSVDLAAQIPLANISEFAIEQETRGLLRGNAGRLLLLAPFGSGRAISMIRTGVELVTLQFTDARGGAHGAILMLPKGSAAEFADKLKAGGVREGAATVNVEPAKLDSQESKRFATFDTAKLRNSVIEVQPVEGNDQRLPAEFRISIYEQLFDGLWNSGLFVHVYRAGDKDAATKPDRLILKVTVDNFKKGNERIRTLAPVGGATVIKAHVLILDVNQLPLVEKDITGSVRTYGDNLDATDSLARKIGKLLKSKAPPEP